MELHQERSRAQSRAAARLRKLGGWMIACGAALVFFAAAAAPLANARPAEPQEASEGQAIFEAKCSGCHTIGKGKLVGPDLQDVTKQRDAQWLKSFLLDPPKMLASDPAAQQLLKEYNNIAMPNLGLTDSEAEQVIAFLGGSTAAPASEAPAAAAQAPAEQAPAGAADPARGRKLFTGEQSLANGGPHCMACHSVEGAGSLGGGALGPDLTHVFQRYGEAGLAGALKNIAFPTMKGPFLNRALTPAEQADLVAFFKEADRSQPAVAVIAAGALNLKALLVFGIAAVAAGLLYGLLWLFWLRIRKAAAPRLPVRKL